MREIGIPERFTATSVIACHVTRKSDLPSILRHGLVPDIGPRSKQIRETAPAVFLFPDRTCAEDAVMNWFGELFGNDSLILLEIQLPEKFCQDNLTRTPGANYEIQCNATIPPEYITGTEPV